MTESLSFGRYLFLAHDASGYSGLDGARQQRAQADIRGVIGRAAELAGLHRDHVDMPAAGRRRASRPPVV